MTDTAPPAPDWLKVPPTKVFTPPVAGEQIESRRCRYSIGQKIAEGAFGAIFEAWDEWNNRLVAKVPVPHERPYPDVRAEWIDELTKLVHLRHPNITFVHDAFEYRDTFYIIIERCFATLNDLILRVRSSPVLVGSLWIPFVARGLLQGVDYIHRSGYVHKDLHAGNVFLAQILDEMNQDRAPTLTVKIGDLGISRVESDIRIFGTIIAGWMQPPEFLDPIEFGSIDRRVDIYHSALLLLSLLTETPLSFTQEEISNGTPRQTAERSRSRYSAAIAKALRRHVAYRTPSALEFWKEIYAASVDRDA